MFWRCNHGSGRSCGKYDREMDRRTRQNLERFAEFMARMIEKYGHKVLAEMEREEAEKQQNGQ